MEREPTTVPRDFSMYPCKHTDRSSLALAGMWNYSVTARPRACALCSDFSSVDSSAAVLCSVDWVLCGRCSVDVLSCTHDTVLELASGHGHRACSSVPQHEAV